MAHSEFWKRKEGNYLSLREWRAENALLDADIEWWAVALLDLKPGTPEYRVRKAMLEGREPHLRNQLWWQTFAEIVSKARLTVCRKTIDEWVELAWKDYDHQRDKPGKFTQLVWDAALMSVRTFVQFTDLRTDDDKPMVMKGFHIKTVNALRMTRQAVVLLPAQHGKSVLSSRVIPLMDWAEWRDCSQIRIYLDNDSREKAVSRLKQDVEDNERIHKLFPWIRKPRKNDKSQVWNLRSFSIGGRTIGDAGFRTFTINSDRIGHRAHRVILDDIVSPTTAESATTQRKHYAYVLAAGQTTPQMSDRDSRYHTKFTTFGLSGTLFTAIDANVKTAEHFALQVQRGDPEYKVIVYDVYPKGAWHKNIVLWPEAFDAEEIAKTERRLGRRVFDMRYRNKLQLEGMTTFPAELVRNAMMDGQDGRNFAKYGEAPQYADLIIGFDPAKGSTSKWAKNPAIVLYGLRNLSDMTPLGPFAMGDQINPSPRWAHSIIKWQRLYGYDFNRQIYTIVEWAREYHCQVAIEINNQQIHYHDYLRENAPDIMVVDHATGLNKRNPDQGVDTFAPLFQNGLISIHAGEAPLDELEGLRRELTQWPHGEFSDIVMAAWIARYQLEKMVYAKVAQLKQQENRRPAVGFPQLAQRMWAGPRVPYGRGLPHNRFR